MASVICIPRFRPSQGDGLAVLAVVEVVVVAVAGGGGSVPKTMGIPLASIMMTLLLLST